jgi:hypothetical protein
MPRRGDKVDSKAFNVVETVVERVHLQLTSVTRTRIHHADSQTPSECCCNVALTFPAQLHDILISFTDGFGQTPGTADFV